MRQTNGWLGVFLLTICFCCFKSFALDAAFSPTALLLNLHCNGIDTAQIVYALQDQENKLWLKEEAFKACRIPAHSEIKIVYEDELFYAINQTGKIRYHYNPQLMTVDLIFPHSFLPIQTIDYNPKRFKKPRPKKSGLYLNYDVNIQRNQAEKLNNYAAITDWVFFNRFGVGHSDFLIKNGDHVVDTDTQNIVRLETTWTLDKPEKMATWRIGDSLSGTAIWSGAVKFGGIQYATNFAVQPGFVTFPLPVFKGEAIVPTTVDFYLNNQLRASQELTNGPFEIQGLPVVTGAGDLMVQTKDLLGRQTVAVIPYYIDQQFLRPGLVNFSYELGAVRRNFGIASNDYHRPLLVGSYQKGLNNHWTAGWHGEWVSDTQTFGLNSSHIIYHTAQINWAGALSHHAQNIGALGLIGCQRKTPWYSLGVRAVAASEHFRQLGILEDALAPKLILQSHASITNKNWGTLTLNYTERLDRT